MLSVFYEKLFEKSFSRSSKTFKYFIFYTVRTVRFLQIQPSPQLGPNSQMRGDSFLYRPFSFASYKNKTGAGWELGPNLPDRSCRRKITVRMPPYKNVRKLLREFEGTFLEKFPQEIYSTQTNLFLLIQLKNCMLAEGACAFALAVTARGPHEVGRAVEFRGEFDGQ